MRISADDFVIQRIGDEIGPHEMKLAKANFSAGHGFVGRSG